MAESVPKDAYLYFKTRLTEARRARMESVAAARTRAIRLVVQDIHDPHNVAACMRSAEAFGVQNIDMVSVKKRTRKSTVGRGAQGWLTLNHYHAVEDCVKALRAEGYKIAAGVPRQDATRLEDLPIDHKIAVVFGNEHDGIHPDWLDQIDLPFTIPMVGMVESLNISVSAAITLHQLTKTFREAWPAEDYHLTQDEQTELLSLWCTKGLRNWPEELRRLKEAYPSLSTKT